MFVNEFHPWTTIYVIHKSSYGLSYDHYNYFYAFLDCQMNYDDDDRFKHETRGVWSWPITRNTPHPTKKKHLKCQIYFFSVFKWFWVIECWWPSKEVFFNTLFPPFGTEKGWRPKNLSPGKIWPTCKKTKHGYGRPWRHPIGKVESSLLSKVSTNLLALCWAL